MKKVKYLNHSVWKPIGNGTQLLVILNYFQKARTVRGSLYLCLVNLPFNTLNTNF